MGMGAVAPASVGQVTNGLGEPVFCLALYISCISGIMLSSVSLSWYVIAWNRGPNATGGIDDDEAMAEEEM